MSRNRNRNRNRNRSTPPPTPAPAALAEVVSVRVADLTAAHVHHTIEVTDRWEGLLGPIAGTLLGWLPAAPPDQYATGATWRTLLIAHGPGKGQAVTVREVDTVRIAV